MWGVGVQDAREWGIWEHEAGGRYWGAVIWGGRRLSGVLGSGGALTDGGEKLWGRGVGAGDRAGWLWGTAPRGESSPTAAGLVPLGGAWLKEPPAPSSCPRGNGLQRVLRSLRGEVGAEGRAGCSQHKDPKYVRARDAGPVACAWRGQECGELLSAPACLASSGCLPALCHQQPCLG